MAIARISLLLALLLAPIAARAATRLAFVGVEASGALGDEERATAEEILLGSLGEGGTFTVIGRSDLASLLGFERTKSLLGCSDDNCLAEIGGAFGAGLVAAARVGKLGEERIASFKILDAARGTVVLRVQRVLGEHDDLAGAMRGLGADAVAAWKARLPGNASRTGAVVSFVAAGALLVAAGVTTGLVLADHSAVQTHCDARTKECDPTGLASAANGAALQPWMTASWAATAVAAGIGTWLWVSASRSDAKLAVLPTNRGALLAFSGAF